MKLNKITFLTLSLLFASFVFCFYQTFLWLHYKYSYQDSYYSHGYMIPFISAYLIYLNHEKLREIKISGSVIGLVIVLFALLSHIITTMADINFISGFSMFFFILGSVLYLFGIKITKELLLPIFFLLFMFPIPGSFIDIIGLPTKTVSTSIGLKIVSLIGIPYYLEGFRINLTNTIMFVGTPCNGMKSLISFAALGMLAVYFLKFSIIKRTFILLSIYPLAIFLNGCRIAILVFIADKYGIEKASPESYLHDMSGIVVFIAGLIILFLLIKLLSSKKELPAKDQNPN